MCPWRGFFAHVSSGQAAVAGLMATHRQHPEAMDHSSLGAAFQASVIWVPGVLIHCVTDYYKHRLIDSKFSAPGKEKNIRGMAFCFSGLATCWGCIIEMWQLNLQYIACSFSFNPQRNLSVAFLIRRRLCWILSQLFLEEFQCCHITIWHVYSLSLWTLHSSLVLFFWVFFQSFPYFIWFLHKSDLFSISHCYLCQRLLMIPNSGGARCCGSVTSVFCTLGFGSTLCVCAWWYQ